MKTVLTVFVLIYSIVCLSAFGSNPKEKANQLEIENAILKNDVRELKVSIKELSQKLDLISKESSKASSNLDSFNSRYEDWKFVFLTFLSFFTVILGFGAYFSYKHLIDKGKIEFEKEFKELREKLEKEYIAKQKLKTQFTTSKSDELFERLEEKKLDFIKKHQI